METTLDSGQLLKQVQEQQGLIEAQGALIAEQRQIIERQQSQFSEMFTLLREEHVVQKQALDVIDDLAGRLVAQGVVISQMALAALKQSEGKHD